MPQRPRYAPQFATRHAAMREATRMLATYRAAHTDRSTSNWPTTNYSADGALVPDVPNLTARQRGAARDDWQAKSIIRAYQRHIQGTGITARAVARHPDDPEQELTAFNRDVDDAWREWAEDAKLCDLRGQDMLLGLVDVQIGDMVTTGNGFLTPRVKRRRDMVPLVLQAFELEQLATDHDTVHGLTGTNGNEIRHGVEIDQFGVPLNYLVHLHEHPLELWHTLRKPTAIPADEVLHLRRSERTRETVSPAILTPTLLRIWRNEQYEMNEGFAKQLESTIAFAVQMDPRYGDPSAAIGQPGMPNDPAKAWGGPGGANGSGRYRSIDLSGGQIPVLFPGESLNMFNPQRPGTMYDRYMRTQIGMNAAGAGLDYATTARDYSTSSYGSLRQGMLELWREMDPYQVRLVGTTLQPLRTLFIELGILSGLFNAPNYWTDARWRRAYRRTQWMPPQRDWIDPAKEAAAVKILLDYHLTSRPREWNRQGVFAMDMLQEIARNRDQAAELGITFAEDAMIEAQTMKAAPSSPKVHGTGDERKSRRKPNKSGASPRTQSAGGGRRRMPQIGDELTAIRSATSKRQRQQLARRMSDRLVGQILASALQED